MVWPLRYSSVEKKTMLPNPLAKLFAEELSEGDVILLNALKDASDVLLSAADALRDIGSHENAETLEFIAEQALEHLEHSAEEIIGERDATEDLEPSQEQFSDFSEELANIYADYLIWLDGGFSERDDYSFGSEKSFGELLRHVATHHQLTIKEDVTDEQLIDAARDAYESRLSLLKRYRGDR